MMGYMTENDKRREKQKGPNLDRKIKKGKGKVGREGWGREGKREKMRHC